MQICSAKRGLWVTGGHRTISLVLFPLFHLVFHFFLGNKIKKHREGRPRVSVRPTVRRYDPSPKGSGRSDGPWAVQTPSDDPLGASYFSMAYAGLTTELSSLHLP